MDRIILIGKQSVLSESIADSPGRENYQVITASPEEAPDIIEKTEAALAFTGTLPAGTDLTGLIRQIRTKRSAEELPLIVFFERHDNELISKALEAGASDYICMPVTPEMVMAKIRSLLTATRYSDMKSYQGRIIQDLIDGIPMITVVVDDNVQILNANFTARSFINKPVSRIFNELGGNVFNCVRALASDGNCGKTHECQMCIIRNSVRHTVTKGESIYKKEGVFVIQNNGRPESLELLVSTSPLTLDNRRVVLLSIDDVTPYKQALREMQEARDLYARQTKDLSLMTRNLDAANQKLKVEKETISAIFDSSNIGITITDSEGKYVMCNSWWTEQSGYTEEEMITKKMADVTHNEDIESSRAWFNKIVNGETDRYCLDKKYIRKDGSFFWADLSVSAIKDENNKVVNVIGIIRDITWFKEATEALMKSELALREAQKIGNIAHWEYDIPNDRLTMSDQAFKIFEIDRATFDLTFKNVLSLLDNNQKRRFEDSYYDSVRKKTNFYFEDSIRTASGKVKYLLGKAQTRYDTHGNPKYTLGTISDITERKEIELQIEQQNVRLKELVATKDKFFSIISHDLRNSFGAILNLSSLLAEEPGSYSTEEIKEFAGLISSTSKSTYELLQNLLEWAKSQQGLITFTPGKVNLHSLADDCVALFKHQLLVKEIELTSLIPGEITLAADTEMLKTILRNLISNAIKFTPRGGRITLHALPSGKMAEISVSDTGMGMSDKTRESLFSIASASSTDGTEGEKGTGLGLILCREFILKHGGEIHVESRHGKGSTFIFTIPLHDK